MYRVRGHDFSRSPGILREPVIVLRRDCGNVGLQSAGLWTGPCRGADTALLCERASERACEKQSKVDKPAER